MKVEIWSDIACPWCYIGKRRFETALAGFEHRDEVEVSWRSFELDPTAPRERGADLATHIAAKYGTTREQAIAMQQRVSDAGAGEGLEIRSDIARSGNTFDAHRLVHLGAEHGRQDLVKERLLRGYHTEGEPIGDPGALARLAIDAGLPPQEVSDVLAGERFAAEVREEEQLAASFGINAVPFFVVDRAIAASGAQAPEVFTDLLWRSWEARSGEPTLARGPAAEG